jgi:hypothetical protein
MYGNDIIPASDIGRTLNMVFDVTNNLKLNQYETSSTDSAVFYDKPSNV